MKIVHLFGTECSGKQEVINSLNDYPLTNTKIWDITEDFYKKYKIITSAGFDFDLYKESKEKLKDEVRNFLNENLINCNIIVVSTGMNPNLNNVLRDFRPIIPIVLSLPTDKELRHRTDMENKNFMRVASFRKTWENWLKTILPLLKEGKGVGVLIEPYTAYEFILKKLGE